MKIVFWTLVDDIFNEYIKINTPLQELSKKYELIAACSGDEATSLMEELYDVTVISGVNDVRVKGKAVYEYMKGRNDYDVLVKIDMDAIVLDLDKLVLDIESQLKPMTIVGNRRKSHGGRQYIRGACNATHSSVIEKMNFIVPENQGTGHDKPFNEAVLATGATQIDYHLFEICKYPTGSKPVWHPPKIVEGKEGVPRRLPLYKKVLEGMSKSDL